MRAALMLVMGGLLLTLSLGATACTSTEKLSSDTPAKSQSATATPDYASKSNWLRRPSEPTQAVDVFYLYPTAYQRESTSAPTISGIDDKKMRLGARLAYDRQATAFEPVANVYAPYYRQLDAQYALELPPAQHDAAISATPVADATAAFEYYLKHDNKGRPFILAGHSQGSNVLIYLLSDYLGAHPDVRDRMVAAYVLGYSVTPEFLAANPHLAFAQKADDTGVIVSWNTQAPDETKPNPVMLPGALAINPLTWTRGEETAPASLNPGSLKLDKIGYPQRGDDGLPAVFPGYADARVDTKRGVVVCSTADEDELAPGNELFPRGVYHTFDYPFYYQSVRENAAARIAAFQRR